MSWFNPKAFAAGALSELEGIIDKNVDEGKVYEDQQRALFNNSKITIDKRRRLVNGHLAIANELADLGASSSQIRAAHSSGLGNLAALRTDILKAMDSRSGTGTKLSKFEVQAMIDSGGFEAEVSDQYDKMDYKTFIEMSMNLPNSSTLEAEPERNIFQQAFGYRSKDAVRAKLDREMGSRNMSILDINEAASRSDYESLMPGAYARFSDTAVYDGQRALKLFMDYKGDRRRDLKDDLTYQQMKTTATAEELKYYEGNTLREFTLGQWKIYGKDAADDKAINYRGALGDQLYNELYLQMFEESDATKTLAANTITVGSSNIEITYDASGQVNKIFIPKTDVDPEVNLTDKNAKDKDDIVNLIAALKQDGLLDPGQLDFGIASPQSFPESQIVSIPPTGAPSFASFGDALLELDNLENGSVVSIAGVSATVNSVGGGDNEGKKFFVNTDTGEALGKPEEIKTKVETKVETPSLTSEEITKEIDSIQLEIVQMTEGNPKLAKLVEEFFGEGQAEPTAATFREFKNSLKLDGISTSADPAANERDKIAREALRDRVSRLGDLILRDGEAGFSLMGKTNSVWSFMKNSYNAMSENAAEETERRERLKEGN